MKATAALNKLQLRILQRMKTGKLPLDKYNMLMEDFAVVMSEAQKSNGDSVLQACDDCIIQHYESKA